MIIKIIGCRNLNFKDQNGNSVSGKQYAFIYEDPRVEGYWFDKFYIGNNYSLPCHLNINKEYDISCYFRSDKLDFSTLKEIQ